MPLKLETKLQIVGNTGTLITSIPKPIAKHFELKKGDKMNIYIKGNHIILEKQE
jgi:AbrB family looped-hinge helix DNA binding protein